VSVLLSRHDPDGVFSVGPGGARTVRDVLHLAAAVRDRVCEAPGPVMLACTDRHLFAASLLGCWMAQRPAMLPASAGDVTAAATGGDACLIVHDADRPGGVDVRTLEGASSRTTGDALPDPTGDEPLVIVRTSGTTGQPQAHPKTARQLLGEAAVLADHFDLTGRRIVSTVAPSHLYGLLFGVLVPLVAGGRIHRSSPHYPHDILAVVAQDRADPPALVTVPPQLDALARSAPAEWPEVGAIFSSGGPLSPTTATALGQVWHPVTEVLGATETGGIASRCTPGGPWHPLPGVAVAEGDDGRLQLRSPFLHPSERLPFAAPDRIRLQPDGTFVHLGRLDDVVKVGGARVSLRGMRAHLLDWPEVTDAAVWSRPVRGARHVEVLAAVASAELSPEAVRARLLEAFDPVTVPRRVAVVAALPRDAVGKLSLDRLNELVSDRWTIRRRSVDAGHDRMTLDPELGFFDGHFPGLPLLPGIVQLTRMVLPAVQERWPDLTVPVGLRRVKFRHPLLPGDTVDVSVERQDHRVRFELTAGGRSAAAGTLVFAAEPKA
jgi:acyl-coenzyme A synthetase/AMP-(fatty) acid ligase